MKNGRKPGQNFQGIIGYRAHLGWRDRLLVLAGAPLMLGVRLVMKVPVPNIRTDATLLVRGKPAHKGTRLEVVDTPPGRPDAQPA